MELDGTVQVVTGAGAGLGRASAELFAAQGAAVVCVDRHAEAARETAELIGAAGGRALGLEADVRDVDAMNDVAARAVSTFGGIDGAFANAGLPGGGSVLDVSIEEWERTLAVNLTGVLITAKAVLPAMLEAGRGALLFTPSIAGRKAFHDQVAYAASKGGVISMARQMALDLAPRNIRVNALCPGTVQTRLVEELYEEKAKFTGVPAAEAMAATAARYPLGRTGRPEDMANMASFLLSERAGWITGQAFSVDGGITA